MNINEKRKKVNDISKFVATILKIVGICLFYIFLTCMIVSVVFFIVDPKINFQENILINSITKLNVIINPINYFSKLNDLDPRYLVATEIAILGISIGLWRYFILGFQKIFFDISKGNSPYHPLHARKLRWIALVLLVLSISQPIMIIFSLIILCISFLFEYGSVLEKQAQETINIQEEVIFSLAEITEAKSAETGNHVKRVSEYSYILAKGLDMSEEKANEIRIAAMMHDVGKILISSEILNKPGKLNNEEFEEIKKHVQYGEKLLKNTKGNIMKSAKIIALEHHEKWNGKGYLGKKGKEISIEGRIVAIADVYDALVSNRSYKKAWEHHEAYNEIIDCSEKDFDPNIVNVFKESYNEILRSYEKNKNLEYLDVYNRCNFN